MQKDVSQESMVSHTSITPVSRKGIILAGGTGSRLAPLTSAISKQLMPVYDKPMIFYPLTTLMLSGIRDILIITKPADKEVFSRLLGSGEALGMDFSYEVQPNAEGIAQAFVIGKKFLGNSHAALILGDNLFHGDELVEQLNEANKQSKSNLFAYSVRDPERYGVIEFDQYGQALSIEEKPKQPKSKFAITGLYFYDNSVSERASLIKPSSRGEIEITTLNQMYLKDGLLNVQKLGRGTAWLDTGTFESLQDAGSYIRTLENRQGLKVGCPEEIAWRKGWINENQLEKLAQPLISSGYGQYLLDLIS